MTAHLSAATIRSLTQEIVTAHSALEGPLLPILHAVQEAFGYVPQDALPVIADGLNLSRAEVHGVMSFYHDFRPEPAGRHVLKVCRAEACQSMGTDALAEKLKTRLGIDWHGTTKDGDVTLEPVYCLGLCAQSPAAMLDGELFARLDDEGIDEMLGGIGK